MCILSPYFIVSILVENGTSEDTDFRDLVKVRNIFQDGSVVNAYCFIDMIYSIHNTCMQYQQVSDFKFTQTFQETK